METEREIEKEKKRERHSKLTNVHFIRKREKERER
jgi:hypothetical protein